VVDGRERGPSGREFKLLEKNEPNETISASPAIPNGRI